MQEKRESIMPYRLQFYVPDEVRRALREVAQAEGVSQQELVVGWITERLARYAMQQARAAGRREHQAVTP